MANDFSGDSNCKALWRFESGALTTDSKGTNTLTDLGTVGEDTVDFQEGAGCADLEETNDEHFLITDANLDSGFPFKNGDTNKKMSFCAWAKLESLTTNSNFYNKWDTGAGKRTILGLINTSGTFVIYIGYNGGASGEISTSFGTNLSTGIWYHICFSFDDSDKSYRLRVWDDNASALLDDDITGNFTNNINIEDAALLLGENSVGSTNLDGKLDEMVVFDDILTPTEMAQIQAGTFGAVGGGSTGPQFNPLTGCLQGALGGPV